MLGKVALGIKMTFGCLCQSLGLYMQRAVAKGPGSRPWQRKHLCPQEHMKGGCASPLPTTRVEALLQTHDLWSGPYSGVTHLTAISLHFCGAAGTLRFQLQLQWLGCSFFIIAGPLTGPESGCDCSDSNFTPRLWCCREAALTAAACAPDGQSAITGDQGGILRVWRRKGRSLTAQNHAGWACTAKAAASGGSSAVPLHA